MTATGRIADIHGGSMQGESKIFYSAWWPLTALDPVSQRPADMHASDQSFQKAHILSMEGTLLLTARKDHFWSLTISTPFELKPENQDCGNLSLHHL
jgi:hypothetical protein